MYGLKLNKKATEAKKKKVGHVIPMTDKQLHDNEESFINSFSN